MSRHAVGCKYLMDHFLDCTCGYANPPPAPKVGSPETPAPTAHWVQDKKDLRIIRTKNGSLIGKMELATAAFIAVRAVTEAWAQGRSLLEAEKPKGGEVTPKPRELWATYVKRSGNLTSISEEPPSDWIRSQDGLEFRLYREVLNGGVSEPTKGIDFSAMARMPKPDPEVTHYLPMYEAGPNTCRYCQMDRSEHDLGGECPIKGCTLDGPPQEGGEG